MAEWDLFQEQKLTKYVLLLTEMQFCLYLNQSVYISMKGCRPLWTMKEQRRILCGFGQIGIDRCGDFRAGRILRCIGSLSFGQNAFRCRPRDIASGPCRNNIGMLKEHIPRS